MATVAESLFGVTPESLQQERQNALLNRGIQLAQLDPFQQAYANIYAGAGNIGRGVGGLLGAEDPELMRVRQRQQLLQGINPADPVSLRSGIEQAMASKDFTLAQELASRALTAEKTQSEITKNLRERAAADPIQQLLRTGKFVPATVEKYVQSGKISDLEAIEKPETKSEFERILGSLDLTPEQEKSLKQQWVQAKLNPDPSGMKSIQATLAGLQAQQLQLKIEDELEKKAGEKKTAIQKLSDTESSLDTALSAADKALKLAPGSFAGASSQALLSSIPWTDAKSLNNLVSTLQSEKVMGTLEQLKAQSRTGATGFGSLTEKELTLLMNRITSLDPTDKMFKQNLTTVMDEWKRVQQKVRNSRRELQGGISVPNAEDLIKRTIEFNKTKGNMSRDAAIQLLKSSGKLPADY